MRYNKLFKLGSIYKNVVNGLAGIVINCSGKSGCVDEIVGQSLSIKLASFTAVSVIVYISIPTNDNINIHIV